MSKNKYMISVIIPCYNAADTIVRTLESVEEQTFKDYEVVLIDDGSLDNTKNIVTNYIKEKDNYVFLKQENKGVSTARNYGLNNAKGKYYIDVRAVEFTDVEYVIGSTECKVE